MLIVICGKGLSAMSCYVSEWVPCVFQKSERHKIVQGNNFKELIQDRLNKLGADGWKVMQIIPIQSGTCDHFTYAGWGFGYTEGVIIIAQKQG